MDTREFLSAARHFFPEIENPVLLVLKVDTVFKMLEKHYQAADPEIKEKIKAAYEDRGYIRTIGGRKITGISIDLYQALIVESASDIIEGLYFLFNSTISGLHGVEQLMHVCNDDTVGDFNMAVNALIAKFPWKCDHKVKLEENHDSI